MNLFTHWMHNVVDLIVGNRCASYTRISVAGHLYVVCCCLADVANVSRCRNFGSCGVLQDLNQSDIYFVSYYFTYGGFSFFRSFG